MPLTLSKAIASDFVNVKDSNFKIMCGGRAFEVHEHVLEEYEYFATMLGKPWKESESKEYLCYESPELLRAMLRHMYGDGTMALTTYCNVLPAAIHDDLKSSLSTSSFQSTMRNLKTTLYLWTLDYDAMPAAARLYAHVCKHLTQLYIAAEQYLLAALKEDAKTYITRYMALAWNHSDVLETVELVLNHISSDDPIHIWLLQQVQERFVLLIREPKFNSFISKVPALQLAKKLAEAGCVKSKEDKTLKYCCYGDYVTGKYCHKNVSTTSVKPGVRKCTVCKKTDKLSEARKRMWPEEGEAEPEPQPAPKKPARKKTAKKRKLSDLDHVLDDDLSSDLLI